jgi:hypothetical protein
MRLQREKADRERFSQARNESSGGRSLALTFGMLSTLLWKHTEMIEWKADSI